MNIRIAKYLAALAASAAILAGCGGSGGNSDATTGTLTLSLTDNAIDAEHVWIEFTGVELKPAGEGPPESYPFDPDACDVYDDVMETCTIDLLALQGTANRTFFAKVMDVGDYQWIRLMVNAERDVMDSYLEFPASDIDGDGEMDSPMMCSLWIPSGSETGLKLIGGIKVVANGSRYMLDFDVRKSIIQPPGLETAPFMCAANYLGKPVLRIVDETESGSIAGVIDSDLLYESVDVLADGCREDTDGVVDVQVYAFEDFDPDNLAELDDYDGVMDPVASAKAEYDMGSTTYSYEIGHLLTGNYRLGLTCTGDVDVELEDNFNCDVQDADCIETVPPFGFLTDRMVDVQVGMNNGDFPPPPAP